MVQRKRSAATRLDTTTYQFYLAETRRQHLLKGVERSRLQRLIRRNDYPSLRKQETHQ